MRIPWLDALVQPEIYNAMAASRRTERLDPEIEDLFEESRFLFKATCHGVVRARSWFEEFEASFEERSEEAPEAKRPPEVPRIRSAMPFASRP